MPRKPYKNKPIICKVCGRKYKTKGTLAIHMAKHQPPPKGRPPKDIDVETLRKLAAMQCTTSEIAAFLDVDLNTITLHFSEEIAKNKELGKSSLRRAQYKTAITSENPTMQIWLGKNWLNQTDKMEQKNGPTDAFMDYLKEIMHDGTGLQNIKRATPRTK